MNKNNIYQLMSIKAFANLDYNDFDVINNILILSRFKPNDVILKEGSHGDSMHFVIEGILEVLKENDNNESIPIATISHGEFIGEIAMIVGFVRTATIRAKTEGSLLTLKRNDFEELIETHARIAAGILKSIVKLVSMNLLKTSKNLVSSKEKDNRSIAL